jgi:hypothetical protein
VRDANSRDPRLGRLSTDRRHCLGICCVVLWGLSVAVYVASETAPPAKLIKCKGVDLQESHAFGNPETEIDCVDITEHAVAVVSSIWAVFSTVVQGDASAFLEVFHRKSHGPSNSI